VKSISVYMKARGNPTDDHNMRTLGTTPRMPSVNQVLRSRCGLREVGVSKGEWSIEFGQSSVKDDPLEGADE
jgi:hypothetical protein